MYDKEVYHFLFLHFPIGLFITGFITALELEYINSIFNISDKPHAYIMILSTILFSILFSLRNMDKKIFFILHLGSVILLIYGTHLGAKWADRI